MQNFRVVAQKLWICTPPPEPVMEFRTAPLINNSEQVFFFVQNIKFNLNVKLNFES